MLLPFFQLHITLDIGDVDLRDNDSCSYIINNLIPYFSANVKLLETICGSSLSTRQNHLKDPVKSQLRWWCHYLTRAVNKRENLFVGT